jgi:hemolysin III
MTPNNQPEQKPVVEMTTFEHEEKPLLRGWSHAFASVAAVIVTIGLLAQTYHDAPRFMSLLIFGVSMIALYGVSSTYHLGNWRGRVFEVLTAIDHANIFVFIAGAYTPICVNLLSGQFRVGMLVTIWILAGLGVICSVFALRVPRWIMTSMYIGMGWISLILLPQVLNAVSLAPVLLLLTGGILYTLGAICYAIRRPNPLPRLFGFHEIFHLCVVAGTVAVTAVIWFWVVPFPRV